MPEFVSAHAQSKRSLSAIPLRVPLIPRLVFWTCRKLLADIPHGSVRLTFSTGQSACFGNQDSGPQAHLKIHSSQILWQSMFRGAIGFADSFRSGAWDTDDLDEIFRFFILNREHLSNVGRSLFRVRRGDKRYHRSRVNSVIGSRKNIEDHYDLGNQFYASWLDPTMTYSSGLYPRETSSLAEAQIAKYERILDLTGAKAGDHILEIGCGWGGLIERAAARGIKVDGITISQEQLTYAQQRIQQQNITHLADVRDQDYRTLEGRYDHIVSIEMIEAVGKEHWHDYFSKIKACLKPGGTVVIQGITICPELFEKYLHRPDFIQRYIFPGGMLPTKQVIADQALEAGLELVSADYFRQDYARTLWEWQSRFHARWHDIEPLGFDQQFRRLWHYYLSYCAVGFEQGTIDVGHYCLRHADP